MTSSTATPAFPQTRTHLQQAITVVGIELRTTNLEAMQTIPPHWGRFAQEGVLARIDRRLSDDVFAVYTHFENAGANNTGLYSLVIGAAVPASAPVPEGMVRVVIPASQRMEFAVPAGRFDLVGPGWQTVWAQSALPKTWVVEYEHYRANGDIAISIGLSSGA
ncbi:MAG: AraC family transcriptional regulator [Comamonadaceae bacterium PBBC2]|nr:MAG: AraC family transcriptional regulator [Comamonadaceae bacterium PBBC2]